jgi:hypothetical protein
MYERPAQCFSFPQSLPQNLRGIELRWTSELLGGGGLPLGCPVQKKTRKASRGYHLINNQTNTATKRRRKKPAKLDFCHQPRLLMSNCQEKGVTANVTTNLPRRTLSPPVIPFQPRMLFLETHHRKLVSKA